MRQSEPNEPIPQHADDIDLVFHQLIYNPDLAAAFAYVFYKYIIIPVGQVFGSWSAPSSYCLLVDVRQTLLATLLVECSENMNKPIALCIITLDNSIPLAQVPLGSHHLLLTQDKKNHYAARVLLMTPELQHT